MANIVDILIERNPWWINKEIELEFKNREIYKSISRFIKYRQIIALVGIRRVGKTTILLKIAKDSINNGMNPENVIYFSFDESADNGGIRGVIKAYEEIKRRDIGNGKYLLLLDEVQKVKGWQDELKAIYDTYKGIKIVISGSESLFIRKLTKETLAGRIFEFNVSTLSFKEFLDFKGVKYDNILLYGKQLNLLLKEFIMSYGFPELIGIEDREFIRKYVREGILEKVIYKDIPEIFAVRDIAVLAAVQNILTENPGQLIELSDLSKELGISRQSLSNYLFYLEESFVVRKLYNYSKNARKTERRLKKYYPSIISASLMENTSSESFSKVFEWFIVGQLRAEFFWRDPQKHEVDIVIKGRSPVPIEVKYGKINTSGLLSFMKRFGLKSGYIISYDKEETINAGSRRIFVIPAFKALLMLEKILPKD